MRSFRFHHLFAPEGRIFDTTGETAPMPPSPGEGWTEHFGEQGLTPETYADKVIAAAVKSQLAAQGPHRKQMDAEHKAKFGIDPHPLATNEEVQNVMDGKTADGSMPMNVAGLPKGRPRK